MKSVTKMNYYKEIIALMPGHVYWKDKDGAFLGCNLEQAKDAGFDSPDDMVGKTDYDMPWKVQADYLRDIDNKVMRSGRVVTMEEIFELPDGTKKTYLSSKLPLYDDNNKISGILGISFDITERKKLQEELVTAKEMAESANQAKTEFLENMRHDIRTPLTGIVGFSEIIKAQTDDPKIAEYAENLMAASHSLLDFLNEILEGIKVFSGEIPEVRQKFCLHDLVTKTIDLFNPRAIEKKISINLDYDKTIPKYIIGDSRRIQRILLELITNALNFTDKGEVNINFSLAKKKDKELVIKCVVEDTGIGIAEDKQDEIFLRFKRLTPSYTGIYKGAGLGLAIVKQFVDDLHGEIYCKSKIGTGTTFTLLLPTQEALLEEDDTGAVNVEDIVPKEPKKRKISKSPKKKKAPSHDKTRILVVEDQPLAAKVTEHIITGLNCTVDIGVDGKSTKKMLREHDYDLIFMDIGLPDTTGYDLTKQIREDEWKVGEHVPIIALTAHVDDENKLTCIESGMDAVLAKPLTEKIAKDIINTFLPLHSFGKEDIVKAQVNLFALEGDAVDIESGIAKLGGTVESAQEMISILVKGFLEDLPKLEEARDQQNWDKVIEIVHKHRGGSYYCGTPRFQQACANLEQYFLSKETVLLSMLYAQLMIEFENVSREEDKWVKLK